MLNKLFSKKTNKKYFSGSFEKPASGRISSGFGKIRTYNNGRVNSHAGVDIANKKGSPIKAPQNGVVLLSKTLNIHGNTVVLDHGLGVVSIYCHLNKRHVKKGAYVKKDQKIGAMGRTGVASGVHLHWGLSVQNVRVNPLFWTSKNAALF